MADMIKLKSGHDGSDFAALHGQPAGPRRGGVIVIQEIFGLDSYIHEDVARWEARGYEVLAPSMYDRQQPGFTARHDDPAEFQQAIKLATANGPDNAMSDIQACIDFLAPRGPVFIVGYCYGGTMVWLASSRCRGLSAGSSYYGGQVAGMASLPLSCPVELHLGRRDGHIPCDEVKAKVQAAHPEVPVWIYEASGHGFNNDGRPDSDPADAELARQRTMALFEANGAG